MMRRLLPVGLIVSGGCLLAWSMLGALAEGARTTPSVSVRDTWRDMGSVPAGQVQPVEFVLQNAGKHPVRVVGLEEC